MLKYYADAGTSWSKILEIYENDEELSLSPLCGHEHKILNTLVTKGRFYIVSSSKLSSLNLKFKSATGHMSKNMIIQGGKYENEILALACGAQKIIKDLKDATIVDLGSRDSKWVRFKDGKYKDLDWNGACGSATGATIEMLCRYYDVKSSEIPFSKEKYPVTCGIFAMEKIMDDISSGKNSEIAISKYIHGIAYNTWNFARKPEKIFLSGGFCENKCFIESLSHYCEVKVLGRSVLVQGLL
ncbi:MAG: BadF/BadG/BcrA/BcrD ATPase family protein [Candidatus Gastranaerophilaceae bacterium]|jgi:activator of 2-hydroxyglutaryl-CoA dehydratase